MLLVYVFIFRMDGAEPLVPLVIVKGNYNLAMHLSSVAKALKARVDDLESVLPMIQYAHSIHFRVESNVSLSKS